MVFLIFVGKKEVQEVKKSWDQKSSSSTANNWATYQTAEGHYYYYNHQSGG